MLSRGGGMANKPDMARLRPSRRRDDSTVDKLRAEIADEQSTMWVHILGQYNSTGQYFTIRMI